MTVVTIYALFADDEEALRIGRTTVEERLAACVNLLGPIRSIYGWKDKIESSNEIAALFKTSESRADSLIARIADLHSYEVPCITSWPVEKVLASYASFVEEWVI